MIILILQITNILTYKAISKQNYLNYSYMHHKDPCPLKNEGPEQGFGRKNCQNASQGKPWFILTIQAP